MASFTTSEYGKFAQIQNNSGSASGTAPEGGVVSLRFWCCWFIETLFKC